MSQARMPLVPAICLLVGVCEAKDSGFIECGTDELEAKRKVRSSETARNGYARQTRDIAKGETPARRHDSNWIGCRKVGDIEQPGGSASCGRHNRGVSL